MLLFKNKETHKHFAVDNVAGKVIVLSHSSINVLYKLTGCLGKIEVLILPNHKTVLTFRKLIAKGILKDVPLSDTRNYLMEKYPEYFI